MGTITINFDWEGNFVNCITSGIDHLKAFSVKDNIINDSYIAIWGYSQPPNLFEDRNCFNLVNLTEDPSFPDWIMLDVNVDESSRVSRTQSYFSQYGAHQIYGAAYNRTTTFGVNRQLKGGDYRSYTFYMEPGFYLSEVFEDHGNHFLRTHLSNGLTKVTVNQERYQKSGSKFSNPYYKTMMDNIIATPPTEVLGDANITINVSSDGKEYDCNKLFLSARIYDYSQDNPLNGEGSILEFSIEKGQLVITNDSNWVLYSIHNIPNTEDNIIEYGKNLPFTGWMNLFFRENDTDKDRTATITVYTTVNYYIVKYIITIIQKGENSEPVLPDDPTSTGSVIVIDINNGEDYDSTSLLFKDNPANIYSTLEAKDNTLFLGNYQNTNFSLKIKNNVPFDGLSIFNSTKTVPFANKSTHTYEYVPDMTISSQDKKLFKKGETYSLGLVFIKKNGVKSSVFYIGDYAPPVDPTIAITSDNKYELVKPRAKVFLTGIILQKLISLDVIGVIPVYAKRSTHKVICQGFLNPTISSVDRKNAENLDAQYNWFQRLNINNSDKALGEGESLSTTDRVEFQCRDDDDTWTFNNKILTFNTPEVEAFDYLTDASLEACKLYYKYAAPATNIDYINSVTVNVSGTYLHSKFLIPETGYRTDIRLMREALWKGYIDKGTINESKSEFIADTKNDDDTRYRRFYVYPWQRSKIGGEGPESKIISKKYFTSSYIRTNGFANVSNDYNIKKASIYKDDFPSLLRFDSNIYQGNVDYIINPRKPYKAFLNKSYSVGNNSFNYPKAYTDQGVYAGYNTEGEIMDPIYMRYKVAPHIALYMDNVNMQYSNNIICAELQYSDESFVFDSNPQVLSSLQWIKCGNIVPLNSISAEISFEEGDYFYGRFDTLRTYPYANDDINSITDIVSGMVCSRINLDSRCDRNRGIGTAVVTNENFNIFNEVYNQDNNYFTFQYHYLNDLIYTRKFDNSIQWSMTKKYGNEIDDWCNIQEINTLDLDGNKGILRALKKLNNNIIAFQDNGISQILYNETMQISSTGGVPIEIANSGKVDGYKVITDTIGCQNKQLMTKANSGLYFIDGLNKSLFSIGADGVKNVSNNGMSVWFRNNIDNITELTYDGLSKDIYVLTSIKTLLYNEDLGNFTTFLDFVTNNYSTIFNMEGRAIGFNQEGSSIAINEMNVGDYNSDYRITYRINPEPFLDKTFTNIEYIANFDNNINNPFKKLIAENEYQYGTSEIVNTKYPTDYKKFRIWRFDVPRDDNTARTINGRTVKLDRIRNPWFNLTLVGNDSIDNNSMEFHNLNVYYYR